MEQTNMVIKAQSPAGFAEEFLIESIWNNRFPPGSILPAERELSDLTPNSITAFSTAWRSLQAKLSMA